LDKVIKN